jgi:hypothetical protein
MTGIRSLPANVPAEDGPGLDLFWVAKKYFKIFTEMVTCRLQWYAPEGSSSRLCPFSQTSPRIYCSVTFYDDDKSSFLLHYLNSLCTYWHCWTIEDCNVRFTVWTCADSSSIVMSCQIHVLLHFFLSNITFVAMCFEPASLRRNRRQLPGLW